MLLYSNTTKAFISRVREDVRQIIRTEMNLKIEKSRIFYNGIYYPLDIVVFEDNLRLGYFDSHTFQLGLSKRLMYEAHDRVLKNIIRHELAHFFAFILHGPTIKMHGEEFKKVCDRYGWDDEIKKGSSSLPLENARIEGDLYTEKLLERLKKLLALASSDNSHERELATLKANQLLLHHNLGMIEKENTEDDTVYVSRVLFGKRKQAKHIAIYEILKTFFVSPVFNHGRGIFYLEVIGNKTNVELAEYVAVFLDTELELMWKQIKKDHRDLKNISAKNSFFKGVSKGYVSKIETQKKDFANENALVLIETNLKNQLNFVYRRLGHSPHKEKLYNFKAGDLGITSGKNLSIKPAIADRFTKNIFKLAFD